MGHPLRFPRRHLKPNPRRTRSEVPTPSRTDVGPSLPKIDAVGLLIIRAWVEEGSSEPLRAGIRLTVDVSHGIERTLTLARVEEVHVAVEEWLGDVLRGGRRDALDGTDDDLAPWRRR